MEAKFILKGGGYLILPEQTCNVQGCVETMDFCSHLNPFVLSVVSAMAYRSEEAGWDLVFFFSASAHVFLVSNGQLLGRVLSYHLNVIFLVLLL